MIKEQSDMKGDLHESYRIVRDAGRLEERQRVLGELALMLIGSPKPGDMHYYMGFNKGLTELRVKIENPREASAVGDELLNLAKQAISREQI